MTDATRRARPWRIIAALVVACLLAVGGWVFAQDKPAVPTAPTPPKPDPAGTVTGGIADVTAREAGTLGDAVRLRTGEHGENAL